MLRRALAVLNNGCEIVTAQSGGDALKRAREAAFDVVITDLAMSGMDGVALTEAIKAQKPDTIVIWITAYGCYQRREDAERLSVYRCLEKPLKIAQIREAVLEALESAR